MGTRFRVLSLLSDKSVVSVGRLFGVEPAELFAQSFESAMVTVSCSAVER